MNIHSINPFYFSETQKIQRNIYRLKAAENHDFFVSRECVIDDDFRDFYKIQLV